MGNHMRAGACRTALLLLLFLAAFPGGKALAIDQRHPLEPVDTSSPGATLKSFLQTMHEIYLISSAGRSLATERQRRDLSGRALRCMDLTQLPFAVRGSLAKEAGMCLKEVLDRIELPPESEWPSAADVTRAGLERWRIPHTDITLVRVKEGPREGDFLFSADTVESAPEFYARVKHLDYIERDVTTEGFYERFLTEPGWMIPRTLLPAWSHRRVYGQALWQWVGLALTLAAGTTVMVVIYVIGRMRAKQMRSNVWRYVVTLIFPITAMLVPLVTRTFVIEQLQIYGQLIIVVSLLLNLIFLLAAIVALLGVGTRLADLIIATPWVQPRGLDAQLIRLSCRVLSVVGAGIILLEGGRRMGIPTVTLATSAGVGGLALALSAQDILKNVLGGMMLTLDKPFRSGERIQASGYDGVVEQVGLRSTRIRLGDGHQASIPNEVLAHSDISNLSRREHFQRSATIELPSDTPPAKIRRALEILRKILENHEGMPEDFPPRVYLRDLKESSIAIFMIYRYQSADYWEFLAFSENVNLAMAEQFEAEEIPFAAPALDVHLAPLENPQGATS